MPAEKEIKDWYNKIYSSNGQYSMRPCEAYSIFLDYLNVVKGNVLLDISCGTGYLLLSASQRGLQTFGIDISEEAVKVALKISPNSKISVGRGENLKFDDNSFDYITCLGSLEHFLDIDKGLQEMIRVSKDNTKFCIMVPNSKFLYWKLMKESGTLQQDINETLLTNHEWQMIFKKNGFQVIDVFQDKWFQKNIKILDSVNPIKIVKNAIFKIAWFFLPLNWTYQFIYILRIIDKTK